MVKVRNTCLSQLYPSYERAGATGPTPIDREWYISITPNAASSAARDAIIWTPIICNAIQLFGPALTCGELRPDLMVHMHEQCILNQVGGGTGDHVINLKTQSFQSKLGASGEDG